MPTYIALMNWTEQGIRDFKDTVSRAKPVSEAAERLGGKIRDDETATAFLLWLGSLGNVRTTTLRAFNAAEMGAIISKAG